jgi:hypothetical protein
VTAWAQRRSRLSHDLIRNRLLPAFGALENIARGHLNRSPQAVLDSIEQTWTQISTEIRSLLDGFIREMSPETLLDEPPLCFCAPETQLWLKPFLHAHWMKTYSVERLLGGLDQAFNATDDTVNQLFACPLGRSDSVDGDSLELLRRVSTARFAVQDLVARVLELPERFIR